MEYNADDDEQEKIFKDYDREPIDVVIQSFGGGVYAALGIIGAITTSKTPIITHCYGMAMSCGFFIFLVGDHRIASPYATFMYHELSYGSDSLPMHTQKGSYDQSAKLMKIMHDIVKKNTKITQEQMNEWDKNAYGDWHLTAEEAKELGVVDTILEDITDMEVEIKEEDINGNADDERGQDVEIRGETGHLLSVLERAVYEGEDQPKRGKNKARGKTPQPESDQDKSQCNRVHYMSKTYRRSLCRAARR